MHVNFLIQWEQYLDNPWGRGVDIDSQMNIFHVGTGVNTGIVPGVYVTKISF